MARAKVVELAAMVGSGAGELIANSGFWQFNFGPMLSAFGGSAAFIGGLVVPSARSLLQVNFELTLPR
jgi:hypothetical protein